MSKFKVVVLRLLLLLWLFFASSNCLKAPKAPKALHPLKFPEIKSVPDNKGHTEKKRESLKKLLLAELREQSMQLTSLNAGFEEQRAELREQRAELREQRVQLTSLSTGFEEQRAQLTSLSTGFEEQRVQLTSLSTGFEEQRVQLTSLSTGFEEQRAELREQRAELREQRVESSAHFASLNESIKMIKLDSGYTVETAVRSGISSKYGADYAQRGLIKSAQDI
jgi:DNA-binding transcriptional MerR regulator